MTPLITMFGLVGLVILIAALLSGFIERYRFPQTLVFLLLGAAVGPYGLGITDMGIGSNAIHVLAVLALTFILFTDAVHISFADIRKNLGITLVLLFPGALLTTVIVAAAAHYLLGMGIAQSAIVGAALASTDPVLLRGVIQNASTPEAARTALRLEGGLNDAVLLPIVLGGIAAISVSAGAHSAPWWQMVGSVVFIGLGAGALIGWLATRALEVVRSLTGMRRDYEALYVIAVSLTAYAAGEAVGGSGFIAAFAAGVTLGALDVELCECFFDYGEATTEMVLLLTFVVLGISAVWTGLGDLTPAMLGFALIALIARPLVLLAGLAPLALDGRVRWMVIWFGPRGLSSLLLVLLAEFAGAPGAAAMFAPVALVVLLSIVVHGGSQMLFRDDPNEKEKSAGEYITLTQLNELVKRGEPVVLGDVRTAATYDPADLAVHSASRIDPNDAVRAATRLGLPYDSWLVLYCT